MAQAVRAHWVVENNLHWILDVVFNEDQSRVRKDHAGETWLLSVILLSICLTKQREPLKVWG